MLDLSVGLKCSEVPKQTHWFLQLWVLKSRFAWSESCERAIIIIIMIYIQIYQIELYNKVKNTRAKMKKRVLMRLIWHIKHTTWTWATVDLRHHRAQSQTHQQSESLSPCKHSMNSTHPSQLFLLTWQLGKASVENAAKRETITRGGGGGSWLQLRSDAKKTLCRIPPQDSNK